MTLAAPGGRAIVVGVGQRSRGDDGVGLAVLAELRARPAAAQLRLEVVAEPSALVELIAESGAPRVVVVDALVGEGEPGEVRRLEAEDLERAQSYSSHGVSVGQAIALARALAGDDAAPVALVAVVIAPPGPVREGLSPAVAGAVSGAADAALALALASTD